MILNPVFMLHFDAFDAIEQLSQFFLSRLIIFHLFMYSETSLFRDPFISVFFLFICIIILLFFMDPIHEV